MDNMKSNDDNLKKLNDDNLDNVSGGTGTEMYQLAYALGVPFDDINTLDFNMIGDKLGQYGVSVEELSGNPSYRNRYTDSNTGDFISHAEVLRRINEGI